MGDTEDENVSSLSQRRTDHHGNHFAGHQSGHRRSVCPDVHGGPGGNRSSDPGCARRLCPMAAASWQRSRRVAAQHRQRAAPPPGRSRAADHFGERQASDPKPGRSRDVGRSLAVVCRGSPPCLWPDHSLPGRGKAAPGHQNAHRGCGRHQSVEFSAGARRSKGGSRAGRWLSGHSEASQPHPSMYGGFCRLRRYRPAAEGCLSISGRFRSGNRQGVLGESAVPQDHFHWLNGSGQETDRGRRQKRQAALARTGRTCSRAHF